MRLKKVGFWIWDDDPKNLVDPNWDQRERELVIAYLKAGETAERWMGYAYCRMGCFDGRMAGEMGSRDFTDGTWLWPEGFAHYLEVHQVKPPEEFVRWALARVSQE
jgi:hypothetical protein